MNTIPHDIPPPPPVPGSGATASVAPSSTKKILLAGSIIVLGFAVAGFHLRRPVELFVNKAVDPVLAAAPLPKVERTETSPSSPPLHSPSPPIPASMPDPGGEKYSQAYPPPILVPDESLGVPVVKKTEEKKAEKPVAVKQPEFKPVHPLSKPVPPIVKADRSAFRPTPKAKSSTQTLDELLPLFDFAENLKPLSSAVQPTNPFQAIGSAGEPLSRELTPLQPLERPLVPLTPKK